jgi:DNA-binding transcriptional ArsR family regulator
MTKVMAVGKYLQPDEEFVISDLETIHIVSEPLRLQILEILKETPKTVKMVAKELGINQVKLYYHFKMLEEHGLLRITEERMVSHLIEKVYQTRARSIRIATDLLVSEKSVSESSETLLAYVFDKARAKLKKGLQEGWIGSDPTAEPQNRFTALRGSMRLAPDQATQFFGRLEALSEDFFAMQSSPPSGGDWYDFVVAMYPVRISSPSLPVGEEKS